jgi:hypothetical protein
LIVGFIDEYRQVYGVESICRALSAHGVQIAPKPCRKARHRPASARDVTDTQVENTLRDLQNTPEAMYGRRKMTRYLRRQGHEVAFCTVDRLMRELSLNGVVRGRRHRTTIPGKDGIRAGDKLNRDFTAAAPNQVWVRRFHLCLDLDRMGVCAVRVRCLLPRDRRLDRGEFQDDCDGHQSTQYGSLAARPVITAGPGNFVVFRAITIGTPTRPNPFQAKGVKATPLHRTAPHGTNTRRLSGASS